MATATKLLPVASAGPPTATKNRVEYRRGALTEWYVNGPLGLEQGFTLAAPPAKRDIDPLTLALTLSGTLRASLEPGATDLELAPAGQPASLRYRGLAASDATGRALRAWLVLDGTTLLVRVDDAAARYPLTIDPFIEQAKLTASDGAAGDRFHVSAAVSGDTVVVGASGDDVGANADQGSAYVFVKPGAGWVSGTETAKLTASDGAAFDRFGSSVAVSGDTIVVGASGDDVGANADQGSAYVFVKPGAGWVSGTETAKLTASDGAAARRVRHCRRRERRHGRRRGAWRRRRRERGPGLRLRLRQTGRRLGERERDGEADRLGRSRVRPVRLFCCHGRQHGRRRGE